MLYEVITLPFQGGEGADGVLLAVPADEEFGHHDRQADQCDTDEVDQDEGAAAVVAGRNNFV